MVVDEAQNELAEPVIMHGAESGGDDKFAALEKIDEETLELRAAMAENDPQKVAEELGDLLFSVVNVSRLLKLQPELVLRKATEKFIGRFEKMEKEASQEKKSLNDYTFEQLDQAWNRSKGL